jgi:phenylacetate-CoA ligase
MLATLETIREAVQPHRLSTVLPRWLQEVPLYQALGGKAANLARAFDLEAFEALPVITKEDIRANFPRNFLRLGVDLEDLQEQDLVEVEHTSGTSEARTALILGQGWWAEQERRALELNPFISEVLRRGGTRRVTINSPSCSNDICYTGVPSMADRVVGNSLYVSLSRYPFLWGEADLARMAAETVEWNPEFLDIDPVYGIAFALYCERKGIRLPNLKFILASYEFVSVAHRAVLQRVFRVPVFNLYGSTETGHLLMEVENGEMQPSTDTGFLEVIDADARGVGELLVTTLSNDYMPLIRYRIGDLAKRREGPYCTRYEVHGRVADALTTPDGRRVTVWDVDQCFDGIRGIAHYQLSQPGAGTFLLRHVPEAGVPEESALRELQVRLGDLLGGVEAIRLEQVEGLLPESSGKFRLCYPYPGNC